MVSQNNKKRVSSTIDAEKTGNICKKTRLREDSNSNSNSGSGSDSNYSDDDDDSGVDDDEDEDINIENIDHDNIVLRCIALHGRGKSIAFREIVDLLLNQCTSQEIKDSIHSLDQQNKLFMYPEYQAIPGKYFRISSNCEDILSDTATCDDCDENCILGCNYCSECASECYNCGLKYNPEDVEKCHAPVGNTTCPCKVSIYL